NDQRQGRLQEGVRSYPGGLGGEGGTAEERVTLGLWADAIRDHDAVDGLCRPPDEPSDHVDGATGSRRDGAERLDASHVAGDRSLRPVLRGGEKTGDPVLRRHVARRDRRPERW